MLLLQRPVVQHTETSAAWWPLPSLWKKTSVCLQCSDLLWGALETAFPDLGLAYSICLEATDNKQSGWLILALGEPALLQTDIKGARDYEL